MEAQNGRQKIEKNSKKNERLKIHAGAGDIIVLGGTIIAAAIGAAFVAHMGRRRGENRERERRKNDEERGLQSLLHLGKGESSTDSLIIQENKGKESLPVEYLGEEESERGEDGLEESGGSSIETSDEAVWPAEVTEQEKETPITDLNEMNHHQCVSVDDKGTGTQSIFPYKSNNDQGYNEFPFGNSFEIQDTKHVEKVAANPFNVNTDVSSVVVNDFSFWSDGKITPQGQTEQCIEKSDTAHVTKNELFDEEVERKEISEEEVEKEEISETNKVKQQLELSETTGDTFASECESNTGVLENLLPSSIYTEQQNGHVSVDTLEGTKEEEEEEEVLKSKSKEVKEFQVEDAAARGGEESEASRNCLEVPRDQSICQEDIIEREKLDEVMPTNDVNNQHDILKKFESTDGSAHGYTNCNDNPVQESSSDGVDFDTLDKETGKNLEDLKITNIEVDLIEKVEDDDEGEKGRDQNTHREVVEGEEEEEEKGGDGLAYLNAKVKAGDYITDIEVEVEKDANGGDGVAAEVENEGRGDDFTHIEVVEEEQQQNRGNHISNKEVEVLETYENGGDVIAIEVEFGARVDAIAHMEVEEEQPQIGGNDITLTKSTLENEVQKGEDDIAPPEVEVVKEDVEGEEEKEGSEEGIADMEVKGVEVDEAKEEKADANAHTQVEAAAEEEQKGGDNISYTEVKELRAEEAEEKDEKKGHCVAYIEVEEEKGHISTQEEVDMVEEVKDDEEEEEDITDVEVTKAKGKEKGEYGAPESLLLKSPEKEKRSPVQEENEIQESIRLDGTSMAEEVRLEKHFEPKYETKQNLETTEKINEMVGITSAERDGNTNGGIQSFLPNNDKNIDVPVGKVVVNDISFSENKQTTPEGQSEQCIEKSGIAHVTKNGLSVEEVERKEIPEEEVEKEEISESNEVKQRLEISEKKSECENNTGVLEGLLPSSIYIENQNGQISVDSLAGKKEEEEEEVLNSNSKEVKEFQVEDVGAEGGEDSEGSRNCLAVSSDQSIFQEDIIEHEKLDDLMPTIEINDQHDILRKFESMNRSADGYTNYNNNPVLESSSNGVDFDTLDKETGEELEDLKTANIEVDLIEKEEEEEDDDDDDEREGGYQNARIEVVESEEEERGGDGLAHRNAKVKVGDDITNIEVEEVEKDENGGDGVAHIEVVEEEHQNRGDHISNKEVEVLEKVENEGDVVAIKVEFQARVDGIAHIEVEEQQQRNRGNDVTHTKSMSKNEIQKGKDDITSAEVEVVKGVESEEEKEGNAEGIAGKEVKGVEVDAAKVERGDANTHIQFEVAEEEEQKGGDNISYTEVEELREEEAEEEDEEKGHCVDYIEVKEEKGDNSTHEEVDMIEEEVEEEKGDKSTHEEVDMIEEEVEEEKEDISTHEEVDMVEEMREEKKGEDITRIEVPKEKGKEKGEDGEQESLLLKSPEKEIRSPVQEENENEIQDSIRSDGTAMEFNGKETCMAEEVGLEKHFEPTYETKQNLETPEKISEMFSTTSAKRDENTNGGIQSFLPHNDECIEVPGGISPVVQEKVHVKDVRAESQNTCNSFELARQTDANVDHGDSVTKECPYGVGISSFLQDDNKQDLQEPDFSCIAEEKDGLFTEAEIESCIEKDGESANDESEETRISSKRTTGETISQTRVPEEEEQLPFIENEMKLQSEMARKATDIVNSMAQVEENGQEHEHNVPNKEAEMTVTGQEKKMDFMLTGHSKVLFFFVLALALALGFLALAYDEQFHSYNHHLPKNFRGLYQYLLSIL